MEKKEGYRTITYRFRLYCEPKELLTETKKMYNRLLAFYYDVLKQESELLATPKLRLMRELELLTIGAKDEPPEQVKYPIPYKRVPLYFRRAAINDAIRLYLSFCSGEEQGARQAEEFNASPIMYKGMYKEFTETSIRLKLYNGVTWKWVGCRVDTCERRMPGEEQMLSPIIVLSDGRAMLHVPVKEPVVDVRTVEERLPDTERICAVTFPRGDSMAVAAVLNAEGEFLACRFIHGGKELRHRKDILLKRMQSNRSSMGGDRRTLPQNENRSIREKLWRISDDAAHKVSRELVDFSSNWNVSLIVVPKTKKKNRTNGLYTGDLTGAFLDKEKKISYCNIETMYWLGRRIASYIKYKSFGEGIVTTTVTSKGSSTRCHVCGADIKVCHGQAEYCCPEGHRGNAELNATVNLGRKFLELKGALAGNRK